MSYLCNIRNDIVSIILFTLSICCLVHYVINKTVWIDINKIYLFQSRYIIFPYRQLEWHLNTVMMSHLFTILFQNF